MLFTNIAISLQELSPTVYYGMWLVCFRYYIFLKRLFSHANNFAMSWTIPGKMLDYGPMRGKKVLASTFIGHYLA